MEVEVEERIQSGPDPNPDTKDIETNNKLFLGDQIKINATVSDSKLQNNVYEVVYIDLNTIRLNDKKTQKLIKLRIHDGEFADTIENEDILEIQVLERKPTHKFVEQHDLKLNMVISVELSLTQHRIREQLKQVEQAEGKGKKPLEEGAQAESEAEEQEQEQEQEIPECLGTAQDQNQAQTQTPDQDPYANERNITTMKHFEFTEVDIDFKNIPDTIDTSLPEFQMDPETTNPAPTPTARTVARTTATATTTGNTIKLKKHKDVLYEMYKVAKHKAQEAKKAAIRAYLEAKEIKAAYLLDDDSEEYSDESDDDDGDRK